MIKKFLYFFNKRQKKLLLLLFSYMLITTIFEMVGLGFIFSIVGVLNPQNIEDSILINKLSTFLELNETELYMIFKYPFSFIINPVLSCSYLCISSIHLLLNLDKQSSSLIIYENTS